MGRMWEKCGVSPMGSGPVEGEFWGIKYLIK